MHTAQSSHIQAHEYTEELRTLVIQFTNGAVYQYKGVDPNTYWAFKQSSTPGGYFHSHIKTKFASEMISPGPSRRRKSR